MGNKYVGDILIIVAGILSIIRAFKVENYLRLCDQQEKIYNEYPY